MNDSGGSPGWPLPQDRLLEQLSSVEGELRSFFPARSTLRLVLGVLIADLLVAVVGIVAFPNVTGPGLQLLVVSLVVGLLGLVALWIASRARARTLTQTQLTLATLRAFVVELEGELPEEQPQEQIGLARALADRCRVVVDVLADGEQGEQAALAEEVRVRLSRVTERHRAN